MQPDKYVPAEPAHTPAKRTRKVKKERVGPKRPRTAFMHYHMAVRALIATANPELGFGALAKKIGDDWKLLPEEEKQVYLDLFNKEKVQYEIEMRHFEKTSVAAILAESDEETA